MNEFLFLFQKLVILDYIIRNTGIISSVFLCLSEGKFDYMQKVQLYILLSYIEFLCFINSPELNLIFGEETNRNYNQLAV